MWRRTSLGLCFDPVCLVSTSPRWVQIALKKVILGGDILKWGFAQSNHSPTLLNQIDESFGGKWTFLTFPNLLNWSALEKTNTFSHHFHILYVEKKKLGKKNNTKSNFSNKVAVSSLLSLHILNYYVNNMKYGYKLCNACSHLDHKNC